MPLKTLGPIGPRAVGERVKFFLKLLGGTRTRIRILGSGSIKKLIEMQNATDSGSGHGPDPRIIPKRMRMHLDPDSGIFMRTPDSHRIRTIRYGPPPPDPIGLELLLCKGYLASKASEWIRECYALNLDHTIWVW